MLDMALACSTSCFLWVLALVALQCGVPQGFILGPIFFSINMYLFGEISAHNKMLVSARDFMLNETKMMSTLVLFSLGLTSPCPRWLVLRLFSIYCSYCAQLRTLNCAQLPACVQVYECRLLSENQTPHEKLQTWRLYGLNYACGYYSAVYLQLLCEILYITITFVKQLANVTLVLMHMLLFLFVADNMLREEVVLAS